MFSAKKYDRGKIIIFVLMMLICLAILVFGNKKISADSSLITVSNIEELEEALNKANQDTEIIVSQTINLPGNTKLDGHGATVRVETPYIQADGKVGDEYSNYGVFKINGDVKIENMKIMGGSDYKDGTPGLNVEFAAIQVPNGIVDLQNITVTRSGRGISIGREACVVLCNSQIVRNAYPYGGGIYCRGGLIMNNCSFSENRTVWSCGGGAMEINGGVLYANNTVIVNNSSKQVGGAINCINSKMYLMNSTLAGNIVSKKKNLWRCYWIK